MSAPVRPLDLVTHSQYLQAFAYTDAMYRRWLDATDLDVIYSTGAINDRDHGCPPPPAWLGQDDHSTGFDIDRRLVLWCEGARFDLYRAGGYEDPRLLDQRIPDGTVIDVACMGTMFWLVAAIHLRLREQGLLPPHAWDYGTFRSFRNGTATDLRRGHVNMAVELGMATEVYTDPAQIAPGDLLGVLRRDGRIGHWCMAGYDESHVRYDGGDCIRTYGASPWAEGVGFDPYRVTTSGGRGWVGCKMYRR